MDPLIIPLKLDSDAALAELRKLAAEGGHAGKKVDEGLEGAGKQAKALGDHLSTLITHQGYQLLRDAAGALAQGYRETADYVKSISNEFTKLQDTLRIIATFRGDRATGEFTVEQARMGAQAGLTPEQWVKFQEQFTGFAGQFIGDEEGKKISKAQGDELAQRAAAFMSARGISAAQGGAIFGELLQQAEPGVTNDVLMQRFGEAYKILEGAKGDPGTLLSQMGQVTASGMGTTEAAKLMRAMAQRDPGEAGTYSRATLRGLNTLTDEQRAELGITEDMSVFEQIAAVSAKAPATDDPQAQAKFLRKYFADERELGGMQAAINFGVRGGQFAAADREKATVTGRSDVEFVESFRAGEGKRAYTEAETAAERVARGEEQDPVMQLRREAELGLTKEGRFEEYTFGDLVRSMTPWAPEVKEQLVNERALQMAQERAGYPVGGGSGEPTLLVNQRIAELLEKIEQKTPDATNRPLAAPPPDPATRQQ